MFEQYTERAARVLKQAGKVSKELGQNYVGTGAYFDCYSQRYWLCGGTASGREKGREKAVLELIRDLISPEGNVAVTDPGGFTPRAEKVSEGGGAGGGPLS